MSLAAPKLDDRQFQDIVDEAKRRIAASCPEWTDHNVSDPGVTLVELFAWMTEMILYRMNRVPDRNYIKFLDLLGFQMQEAQPARTPVTFYLSSPQPTEVEVPGGTEVATLRTEAQPSILFSTTEALQIHPPQFASLITRSFADKEQKKARHRAHELKQLGVSGFQFNAFGDPPQYGDALYFGFDNDLSNHVLSVELTCDPAVAMGIDAANPPWQWEGWHGGEGDERWLPVIVERDETGGMNQSGRILLRLPELAQREMQNQERYWIRCRVIEPEVEGTNYEHSSILRDVQVDSWGGTVPAMHATVVDEELLGRSDGSPGQAFELEHAPLLERAQAETLEVQLPGEEDWESWQEVEHFGESTGDDKVFTLASANGELRLGPALRMPDGSVRAYGAVPPRGAKLRFSSYRHGGGVKGNVQAGALNVLKSSIPYVDRVTNHQHARGGLDAETIEHAQMRAPSWLRSRGRAVTPTDYEALATTADPRVHRARCVQPEASGNGKGAGQVYVLLVPQVRQPEGHIEPEALELEEELQGTVADYLDEHRLLTVRLDIREPEYVWASLDVRVTAEAEADPQRVRRDVEQALYRFLNPVVGGADGEGWPFGRDLFPSDIYALLQSIQGVQYLESVNLFLQPPGGERKEVSGSLSVPRHGLIASGTHRVRVK